jgi:hypothetical protein
MHIHCREMRVRAWTLEGARELFATRRGRAYRQPLFSISRASTFHLFSTLHINEMLATWVGATSPVQLPHGISYPSAGPPDNAHRS